MQKHLQASQASTKHLQASLNHHPQCIYKRLQTSTSKHLQKKLNELSQTYPNQFGIEHYFHIKHNKPYESIYNHLQHPTRIIPKHHKHAATYMQACKAFTNKHLQAYPIFARKHPQESTSISKHLQTYPNMPKIITGHLRAYATSASIYKHIQTTNIPSIYKHIQTSPQCIDKHIQSSLISRYPKASMNKPPRISNKQNWSFSNFLWVECVHIAELKTKRVLQNVLKMCSEQNVDKNVLRTKWTWNTRFEHIGWFRMSKNNKKCALILSRFGTIRFVCKMFWSDWFEFGK